MEFFKKIVFASLVSSSSVMADNFLFSAPLFCSTAVFWECGAEDGCREQIVEASNIVEAPPKNENKIADPIDPRHIAYLMQIQEFSSSINLYQEYRRTTGKHNFEVLQQMALILLDQGAHSIDPEKQLLSIFGAGIGGLSSMDILESGIKSKQPETQVAAIRYLGRIQDDRSDELLNKAMSSEFFFARMEAAEQLALRKAASSVGQIESLMYRVPPPFRVFFPPFFALIGTTDAIAVLRHLMDDVYHSVRIEAIMSAANLGRDDLLPAIRARITHLNLAEQEACAAALGMLRDSKSLSALTKLSESPSSNVRLSALKALYSLGDLSVKDKIFAMAQDKEIFAIATCGDIPGSEEILAELVKNEDMQISLNAAVSLLKRKDVRSLPYLYEFLLRDERDLGFLPAFSLGRSQMAWKIVSSAAHQGEGLYDLRAVSLQVREHILRECLELPEKAFLSIASQIFESRQTELVPLLVGLLENLQTENAVQLLQKKAQTAGAPLIRSYCNLALFRIGQSGPYESALRSFISHNKAVELIRFRPMMSWAMRFPDSSFDLTPEESSRLLIESYQALAEKHDAKSIDSLLEALKEGNAKNRYVLSGLLLLAIQ